MDCCRTQKNAQVNNPSCVMSMCRSRPISDRQQPFWKDCRIFAASRYRWLLYIATDTTTTMATASAPYDVATICSVCLEPYKGRTPKLLPCFHTLCLPCLKDLEMHHKVSKITLILPFWIFLKWNKYLVLGLVRRWFGDTFTGNQFLLSAFYPKLRFLAMNMLIKERCKQLL